MSLTPPRRWGARFSATGCEEVTPELGLKGSEELARWRGWVKGLSGRGSRADPQTQTKPLYWLLTIAELEHRVSLPLLSWEAPLPLAPAPAGGTAEAAGTGGRPSVGSSPGLIFWHVKQEAAEGRGWGGL